MSAFDETCRILSGVSDQFQPGVDVFPDLILRDPKASRSLRDNGQPDIVKEVIARRIISLAQKGERDPDRLCARALAALGDKAEFKK